MVNCIDGDFIYDLTPCAPNNMWSLSRGIGLPEIVEYTTRDQTMFDWNAGHAGVRVSAAEIFFSGGFYSQETWSFKVDRISGRGTLRLWKTEKPLAEGVYNYTCRAKKPQL